MADDVLSRLKAAIQAFNEEQAVREAAAFVESGRDIHDGILAATEAIRVVGDRFGNMEIYLPELMMAADVMKAVIGILDEGLKKSGQEMEKMGKIVLGTVKGDIHDIGKTLVATMLSVAGFEVIDIGIDATVSEFLDNAETSDAAVIGMSSLLTTSQSVQRDVIKYLRDAGARDKYFVIVGGGSITPEWTKEIGADGYAEFASGAVDLCDTLVGGDVRPPYPEPVIL